LKFAVHNRVCAKTHCMIFKLQLRFWQMIKKIMTYLLMIALTVLPVQLISAGVESTSMHMNMEHSAISQTGLSAKECLHNQVVEQGISKKHATAKSCCDDQSQQCKSCNHCLHVTVTSILPSMLSENIFSSASETFLVSHLVLNGVSHNNLLRPPRV